MSERAARFRLFEGLPRQGPGSDAATRVALRRLPPLPRGARVVDMGCGSGRAALVLAETLGTRVVAVDIHRPFLDQLAATAARRGLSALIEPRLADMADPRLAPASVDLLWSEGAIYLLGFAEGLRLWRPLLVPDGLLVASECSWLSDDRPGELVTYWQTAYPAMADVPGNTHRAEAAGYRLLDHVVLPSAAWWTEYYDPLQARMRALEGEVDDALEAMIAETRAEMALSRRYGDRFGYVFYLLQRYA
jgi:SAM-dependent methyltransferase